MTQTLSAAAKAENAMLGARTNILNSTVMGVKTPNVPAFFQKKIFGWLTRKQLCIPLVGCGWGLWSVKACPADHPGRFSVFALLLIVTPPNLQNHLTLASEGYLNNQCFGSSSRNVAVGGEVREKHNPEMSVCNGDSTSGRCRRTQT